MILNKETQISDCEHTLGLFCERIFEIDETTCYNTIWDNRGVKLEGTLPESIQYFLILSLNRSMWIREWAMSSVFATCGSVNSLHPFKNGGISRVAPFSAQRSCMVKPQSARITSPSRIFSKILESLVI